MPFICAHDAAVPYKFLYLFEYLFPFPFSHVDFSIIVLFLQHTKIRHRFTCPCHFIKLQMFRVKDCVVGLSYLCLSFSVPHQKGVGQATNNLPMMEYYKQNNDHRSKQDQFCLTLLTPAKQTLPCQIVIAVIKGNGWQNNCIIRRAYLFQSILKIRNGQ